MKVMIVEDDLLVRLGIKSMIAWAELGMEVVCEARDGAEALELFSVHLPDIALVDIGLPRMDGLEFIERVKHLRPDGEFIILTCNQDFELVRRALRLGVRDFFVKSTMEIEELQTMLLGLSDLLRNKQPLVREDETELLQLRQIRKMSMLREWLEGVYSSGTGFREKLEECGLMLTSGRCQAWVIRMNTAARQGSPLLPADLVQIGRAVETIAGELYRGHVVGLVEYVHERRWHLLLHASGQSELPDAGMLIDSIQRYLGLSVTIAASEPFESWQDWGKRDADAREMLSLSFYNEEQNLFREKLPEPALPLSLLAWKRDIVRQLSCFQWEDAERMLDMLPELQPYPRPALLLNLLADVMFQLNRIRERMGIRTDQEEGEGAGAVLSDCCTLSACVEAIRSSIRNAGKWGGRGNHRKYVIEAVEMYLDEHSFEEISLNGVSALFNMSPAQLSRLYKEEKGLNFSEAVLAAKVEQAERMMQSGMSLTDIADKLGYLNPSSFTRMFKKARGVAPSYYTGSQSL